MYPNPTAVQRCAAALQRIAAEHAAAAQHHGGTAMLRNTSESSADEPSSAATVASAQAAATAHAPATAQAAVAAQACANGSANGTATSATARAEYGVSASTASRQGKVGASLYGGSCRGHDAMHGDHASYQTGLISGTRAPSSSTLEADYVTLSSRKGGKK